MRLRINYQISRQFFPFVTKRDFPGKWKGREFGESENCVRIFLVKKDHSYFDELFSSGLCCTLTALSIEKLAQLNVTKTVSMLFYYFITK